MCTKQPEASQNSRRGTDEHQESHTERFKATKHPKPKSSSVVESGCCSSHYLEDNKESGGSNTIH